LSIFEYDEEKELEKLRRAERRIALAEGHAVAYIALIRKKHQTGKSIPDIILTLELEEAFVKAVIEILNQSPDLNDAEIAGQIITTNADMVMDLIN